jgi:hypothetical protein
VAQQQLDLLKLPARRAAQLSAGTAQVMRRNAGNAQAGRILAEHLPDHLFAQVLTGNSAGTVHGPKNVTNDDARWRCPRVDRDFHPSGHRCRTDAAVFANQIDNAPPAIALLNMSKGQGCHFRSPESTSQKDGEDGAIA